MENKQNEKESGLEKTIIFSKEFINHDAVNAC